jgi:hypothetical protein
MKLLRYGSPGREKPAVLAADGKIHDLSGIITDVAGEFLLQEWIDKLRNLDASVLPIVQEQTRIGPCVGGWESSFALA